MSETFELEDGGTIEISDRDAERLREGKSITVNIFPPDRPISHEVSDLYFDDAEQVRKLQTGLDQQIREQGEKAREYARQRYGSEYAVPEAFWRKAETASRVHIAPAGTGPLGHGYENVGHINEAVVQEMLERQAKRKSRYNYPPGATSAHRSGEADMDPTWPTPTLDERLTINTEPEHDPVNHPAHYTEGREIEPIDVIDDWDLDFYEGQVLKYIARRKKKGRQLEDTKKAKFYMDRLVAIEEENCND